MADRYVYSGATGAGTGADWANAHTTLFAAITASAAGDRFFVADDHAETQASLMTLAFKGTAAARDKVYCVRRSGGSVPPVAADLRTTATVTTTGTSNMTITGHADFYGITFGCGTGSSAVIFLQGTAGGTNTDAHYYSCVFKLGSTSSSTYFRMAASDGSGAVRIVWNNCSVQFAGVSQRIQLSGANFEWENSATPILGATQPTTLFTTEASTPTVVLTGIDFSGLASGKTISASATRLVNCKLPTTTVFSAPAQPGRFGPEVIACDNGTNLPRWERYRYQGALTTELMVTRSGGALADGVSYSWRVATTANASAEGPFECFDGAVWNDDIGVSKTLTVHVLADNVTLKDDEIWLEAFYHGSAGSPLASLIADGRATVLTAGVNQATDGTSSWTTTGITDPVLQKLEVTFTPQLAGLIFWRVKIAKASTTIYVDPKPTIS